MTKLLNADEAAEMLGVPLNTLRFWISRNQGPASFLMGRRRKFRIESIEAFIESKERAEREKTSA